MKTKTFRCPKEAAEPLMAFILAYGVPTSSNVHGNDDLGEFTTFSGSTDTMKQLRAFYMGFKAGREASNAN